MNPSSNHTSSLQISQNPLFFQHRSLGRKITRKVFHPLELSSYFELTLIFIQCSQLFSELLLHSNSLENTLDFSEAFVRPILFFAQLFCPGWLLDFTAKTELSLAIVCLMVILCLMKLGLIGYAIAYATERIPRNKTLLILVNWELKTLVPVTFFLTLSIFSRMILLAWQDNLRVNGLGNLACIIGFSFLAVLRSGIVIGLLHFLTYLVPNRSLLAVNSESVDLIIVFHQLVLLILQFFSSGETSKANLWILTLTSFFFCSVELYLHFTRFVSQNIKSLYFKGYLLGLITLFNLMLVVRVFVISVSPESRFGVDTTLILFGVLSPVILKLVKSYLNGALLKIMETSNDVDPQRMLCKISVLNYCFKNKRSLSHNSQPSDLENLLYTASLINADKVFEMRKTEAGKEEMFLKEKKNQIITRYLEVLCEKFPESDLVKLNAAYYHGRKLKNYEPAIKLLAKIENTNIQNISISACLLKRDFETLLQAKDGISNSKQIDLKTYLNSKMALSRLQMEIFQQIDLQIQVYQGYVKNQVNVVSICDASLKVVLQRKKIAKTIFKLLPTFPEGYLEPYFLLKRYYLTANHSLGGYYQYSKIFQQKILKLQKNIDSHHINPDNLYDPQNVFLVISGQKESIGQIHYCSKATLNMLGWDPESLNGKNISTIIPPILHKFYADIIETFSEERTKSFTDDVFQAFARHRTGYIIQVDVCFAVHPWFHKGFFLDVVIRPTLEKKDHIIFTEEGKIAGFTKKVGRRLNLLGDSRKTGIIEINRISQRLGKVNEALNLIKKNHPSQVTTDERMSLLEKRKGLVSMINSERKGSADQLSTKGLTNHGEHRRLSVSVSGKNFSKGVTLADTYFNAGESVFLNPITEGDKSNSYGYYWKVEEWNYSETEVRVCVLEEDETKAQEFVGKTEEEGLENFDVINEKRGWSLNKNPQVLNSSRSIFHQSSQRNLLGSPQRVKVESSPRKSQDENIEFPRMEQLDTWSQSLRSWYSQRSQYQRISRAYEEALQAKYYPKYISYASRLIAIIFLVVLGLQIHLQVNMDHNLKEMNNKKGIIEVAELRSGYLVELTNSIRYYVQSFTPFDWTKNFKSGVPILQIIAKRTVLLEEINENLHEVTSSLDHHQDQGALFLKDVRIYDLNQNNSLSENFIQLTHFQALTVLTQAISRALSNIKANYTSLAIEELKFVLKNSLNDLLEASERTVNIFFHSLKSLENDTYAVLLTISIICIVLLAAIFGIGVSLTRVQYVKMKKNITAFGNLDSRDIEKILNNLMKFRYSAEDETYIDKEHSENLNEQEQSLLQGPKKFLAKTTCRGINYHTITRKYIFYGVKLAILTGIAIGLLSGYQVLLYKRIHTIQDKLYQAHSSAWMSTKLNLCFNSLLTLFSPDTDSMIRNQPVENQAEESLANVKEIVLRIMGGYFTEQDGISYDPHVSEILYGDGCSQVPKNTTAARLCAVTQTNGNNINFISTVGGLEYIAYQLLEKYNESNKTVAALIDLSNQANIGFLRPLVIQEALNQLLSERLSLLFEESVEVGVKNNKQMGIWIDVIIVLMAGLMWLLVVKRIREVDNEFKNVLSVFPANIVLSNFSLKNYLKETSSEAFNILK